MKTYIETVIDDTITTYSKLGYNCKFVRENTEDKELDFAISYSTKKQRDKLHDNIREHNSHIIDDMWNTIIFTVEVKDNKNEK